MMVRIFNVIQNESMAFKKRCLLMLGPDASKFKDLPKIESDLD